MLFLVLLATLIGAFAVVFVVLSLSPTSLFLTLIVVLIVWVVFRSYRKWAASKLEEETGGHGQEGARIFLELLNRIVD